MLFLSHAGVDTEAARRLKQRLEAAPEAREHGLRVWFDKDDLHAGEPWQAQLEKAIRHRSTAFAVYVGSRGVVNWVDAEVQLALSRAVVDPSYRFIPILAPQAPGPEALPGFVALYQGVADVEGRPDQFEKLIAAILGRDAAGTAKLEAEPFFGLKAVDEDRAHLFFGREQETETLLRLLGQEPLVMVTGDSGSGKSSLVRAGLVPRWRGNALAEAMGERPSDTVWHVVQTQPRTHPFQALAEAVSEAAKRLGLPLADRGTLESWARSGDPDQVRRALWCDLPPGGTRVLLLVDQFEELVTIAEPGEREPFVQLLLALADPNDPRARVVLTMRRDYYNLVSTFPELYDRLEADGHRARLILGRISPDGLRRIVTEPLRLAGVPEGDRTALADQVVAEMGDRPGDLALVQMALTETWDRRRGFGDDLLRAYAGVGRIEGAIARAAEDAYTHGLDDPERALAAPVFIRLVHLGDTGGATRRLATRNEFDDAKWRLIQKLASKEAKRLVLVGGGEAGETAEIAHEALVTQWPRYQTWLSGRDPDGAERAADKRTLDALTPRAVAWAAAPDARARAKRLATGADLDAFVGLAERRRSWLSADEHKFVSESRGAALRQQRRERWLFRSVVAALVVAVVGGSVAWRYAEQSEERLGQAIDITKGFVKKAVELSDLFGVPRPAIEELLTQANTGYKQLMQKDTKSPRLDSARAELLMLFADHYRIIGEEAERWGDAAKQAHDLLKELAADDPSDHELLKQLADSHDLIGDIHAHRTELDAALSEYRKSQSIREKLLTDYSSNPPLKRDLSISQQLVGDILLTQGHLDEALAAFEKALGISEPLARAELENATLQRDVLVINHRIGDVLIKKGDLKRAGEAYRSSLSIAKRLATGHPSDIQLQYDLLASHERVGDYFEHQGDMKAALDAHRTSLSIAKQLAHDDPEKVDIQRHVSLGYDNVGRILLKQGDLQAALEAFRASLVIAEKLAVADPENAFLQRDRSIRLNKIGDALKEHGDLQAALDHYRKSFAIRRHLAAVNPSSAEFQRDVSMSYDRMGDVLEKLSQVQEAIAEYQASRVIAERLAAAEPANAEWQRDLYTAYRNLGRVQEREGNREEARDMYCLAKKVVMTNSALPPANSQWQERLDWLEQRLAVVRASGASQC